MGFIEKNACHGAVIGLMAAKNKEGFYEKYGFWQDLTNSMVVE